MLFRGSKNYRTKKVLHRISFATALTKINHFFIFFFQICSGGSPGYSGCADFQKIYYSKGHILSDPLKLPLWMLGTLCQIWSWKVLEKTRNLFHVKLSNFSSWLFNVNMKLQQLKITLNIFQWLSILLKKYKN